MSISTDCFNKTVGGLLQFNSFNLQKPTSTSAHSVNEVHCGLHRQTVSSSSNLTAVFTEVVSFPYTYDRQTELQILRSSTIAIRFCIVKSSITYTDTLHIFKHGVYTRVKWIRCWTEQHLHTRALWTSRAQYAIRVYRIQLLQHETVARICISDFLSQNSDLAIWFGVSSPIYFSVAKLLCYPFLAKAI